MSHDDFNLDIIAARLSALEESIIVRLLERAQFCHNPVVYLPGHSGFSGGEHQSLFEIRLRYQEEMDAVFGRFCVPEERPFYRDLPAPRRIVSVDVSCLGLDDFERINLMPRIVESYLALLPEICPKGDDGQYGSSVEHDVMALQALGRRIHYGSIMVAESKFRMNREGYTALIKAEDRDGLLSLLSRPEVEETILARVREKTSTIQSGVDRRIRRVVEPDVIVSFYRDTIIPLTKEGEVLYLLNRRIEN
ncbi:chorismate mutase [Spirochaetia bacterium 38H-sp]|uniref:Chorismate mutase n=1 Tax=Rarispira pelagica TaxID=3141764 RepID=A0ABU9UBY4_9SPIR